MSEVVMPRLSDTMEEGELAKWLKNEGDEITKGDILAEIETDKATMDLEAFESGTLEKILVEAGSVVAIGTPVAMIGDGSGSGKKSAPAEAAPAKKNAAPAEVAEEEVQKPLVERAAQSGEGDFSPSRAASAERRLDAPPKVASRNQATAQPEPAAEPAAEGDASASDGPPAKLRMSPLARKIAKDHGIDLANVTGTGTQGRIVRADVEAAITAAESAAPDSAAPSAASVTAAPAAPTAGPAGTATVGEDERVPANRLRSVAAKRLTESQAVPHFFLTSVVDVEKLLAFRKDVNAALEAEGLKASINDVIVRAVAVALRQHPEANASWIDDEDGQGVIRRAHVNVGIAVATEAGLLVPVIRDADHKSLGQISTETVALAEKARDGKLSIDEMTGGTFSISNLGMFGIDQFTAVINPPEAAILAVGAASPVPVLRDGVLVDVQKLRITLTVDHRVMDGAIAAGFLRDLVGILEQPLRMLL